MLSCGMCPNAALVRTKVSEQHITTIIRVERIRELGTTLGVASASVGVSANYS
jgi:hypothetical protein